MSFAATNARFTERYLARGWVDDYDEVVAFARDMVAAMFLVDVDSLQEYYESPQKWQREHSWWVANERPDTWQMWDKGIDEKFEVTT